MIYVAGWFALGALGAALVWRHFKNAYPDFPGFIDVEEVSIAIATVLIGPIGLLFSIIFLRSARYGFSGKKSPWRTFSSDDGETL